MKTKTFLMVALLMVCISAGVCAKGSGTKVPLEPLDTWMGVYYNNTKIGYLHTTIQKDKYEGKDVIKREDVFAVRFRQNGEVGQCKITCKLIVDTSYNPLYEIILVESDDSTKPPSYMTELKFSKNEVVGKIKTADGEEKQMSIPLDEEDRVKARLSHQYDLWAMKLVTGNEFHMSHVYLIGCTVEDEAVNVNFKSTPTVLKVVRGENIQLDGSEHDTMVVSEVSEKGTDPEVLRWHLKTGEVVKIEIPANHITYVQEPREKAILIPVFSGPDISEIAK